MGFDDDGDKPFSNVSSCPIGSEIRERQEHHFAEHRHNAKQTEARVGRLTRKQVVDIFRLSLPQAQSKKIESKTSRRPSAVGVAREYGVSEKTVRDIWTGRTWSETPLRIMLVTLLEILIPAILIVAGLKSQIPWIRHALPAPLDLLAVLEAVSMADRDAGAML
jgi:hypothetical protein